MLTTENPNLPCAFARNIFWDFTAFQDFLHYLAQPSPLSWFLLFINEMLMITAIKEQIKKLRIGQGKHHGYDLWAFEINVYIKFGWISLVYPEITISILQRVKYLLVLPCTNYNCSAAVNMYILVVWVSRQNRGRKNIFSD